MYSTRRKLWRLFAVMATVMATLVPAAIAGAGAGIDDHECDDEHYQAGNPSHYLYGRTVGTPVDDGRMVVDLSGHASGRIVFWDGVFSVDPEGGLSTGAHITGTPFADIICGTEGDDIIFGRQGGDRIFGMFAFEDRTDGVGDEIYGNKGHDFETPGDGTGLGDTGSDTAIIGGGRGRDVLYAGDGDDTLVRGGMHDDTIFGGDSDGEDQILRGGADNDYVNARDGDRTLAEGSAGNDWVEGGGGFQQILNGNSGNDSILGGEGNYQRLFGGSENDELTAGTGYTSYQQALFGGSGDDVISGQATSPSFNAFGGSGDDMVFGGVFADNLWGDLASGAGEDPGWNATITGYKQPFPVGAATSGNDWIEGGDGSDDLYGGPGDDTIYGNTPKVGAPNDGMDVSDGDGDDSFGNDGDDLLLGSGSSCDSDFADGGANHVAGDTSRGYNDATGDVINVENVFDKTPGCVTA